MSDKVLNVKANDYMASNSIVRDSMTTDSTNSNSTTSNFLHSVKKRRHYWNCQELVTIGVFAACAKIVTIVIALAGGGPNPITIMLKNLVFTALLIIMLHKVRKAGTLTLYMLVSYGVSFILLGGGVTSIPANLVAALIAEACVFYAWNSNKSFAPIMVVGVYDLFSRIFSMGFLYLYMRENIGMMLFAVVITVVGYLGAIGGLFAGYLGTKELRRAGIINR